MSKSNALFLLPRCNLKEYENMNTPLAKAGVSFIVFIGCAISDVSIAMIVQYMFMVGSHNMFGM